MTIIGRATSMSKNKAILFMNNKLGNTLLDQSSYFGSVESQITVASMTDITSIKNAHATLTVTIIVTIGLVKVGRQ